MTNAVRDRRLSLHGPMAMPRRGFPYPRRAIGTAASASGPGKRTGSNASTAPRADSTTAWSILPGRCRSGRGTG